MFLGLNGLGIGRTRGSGTFLPTSISNCKLWLRADLGVTTSGGLVTAWADQSGNGNNATDPGVGVRPALTASNSNFSNQSTVDFDGTDDFLTGAITIGSASWAVYAVVRYTANSGAANAFGIVSFVPSGGANDNAANSMLIFRNAQTQLVTTVSVANKSVSTIANNTTYVFSSRCDGANNTQRVNTTDGTTVASTATVTVAKYYLGSRWVTSATSLPTPINIAEFIVYSSNPSSGDNTSLRSYFQARYGVAS